MRMRSLVVLGVGVFLLALAPLVRFYMYPRLTGLPRDYFIVTTSTGPGATVFDFKDLKERHDATITVVRTIKGDAEKGNGRIAVWDVFQVVKDERGNLVDISQHTLALNRRTGLPVHCCGENVNRDVTKHFDGITYKFPYHTGKRTYQVFDDRTAAAWPMAYAGTERIDGLRVYRFVQHIPATKVAEQAGVPGGLVGAPDKPAVTAGRYYQSTRTFWVEPRTGAIVKGQDEPHNYLAGPTGGTLDVMTGRVTLRDADVNKLVRMVKSARRELTLLSVVVPLVCLLLGLVLVLVAVGPALRGGRFGRRGPEPPDAGDPPLTPDEAEREPAGERVLPE